MHLFTSIAASAVLIVGTVLSAGAQSRGIFPPGKPLTQPPVRINAPKAPGSPRVTSDVFTLGSNHRNSLRDADDTGSAPRANAPVKVLGDGTVIYGSLVYTSEWAGTTGQFGIYSFTAGNYAPPTLFAAQQYDANGGGCLAGDVYHYNHYIYTDEMGYTFVTFCSYNIKTGEFSRIINSFINDGFDQRQVTHDMAYDPVSGRIFAVSYTKKELVEGALEKFVPAISEIDPISGLVSPIAETPQLAAIACSLSGELYGISMGSESTLYRINKSNGECTAIGRTGLNPAFVQSATFDPVTNKLYWAACQANFTTGLYEVNLSTGHAEKITDFDNMEEYAGLYIPKPDVAAKAPAAVSAIAPSFSGGALSGSVTVTAPTLAYDGSQLSGNVTLHLLVDGAEVASKQVQPGQQISHDLTLTEGIHGFVAYAGNTSGAGPRTGNSKYVGIDAPEAPLNVALVHNADGTATISWQAPQKGRNDGYIVPSQVRYNVTRMPDAVRVASGIATTTFTDPLDVDAGSYYYEVTGVMDGREGPAAVTGTMPLGRGSSLPCRFSFDTKEQFDLCTVIDANQDADTQYHWGYWMYSPEFPAVAGKEDGTGSSPCAVYGYSPENAADDWIISPSFTVEQGKKYRVTYTLWTRGDKEKLEVTAGPHNTVAAQSIIHPATEYNHKDKQQFSHEFTASASGNYYVGFHVVSGKKRYYLFIDDITVDAVADASAPAPVTDLTATAGERGALTATVSFTAPTKTKGGATLGSISHIDIFRGNAQTPLHSFSAPAKGTKLTWTDNNPRGGWNDYRVVAYNNGDNAGEKAETRVFVGVDTPLPVTGLTLSDASGKPVISWQAPTEGENGGYIDPAALTYQIVRNDGVTMTRNATGTSFTDETLDPAEKQYFIYYAVTPMSTTGQGEYAVTDHLVYGDPYQPDFFESFSDAAVQNDPWTLHRVKGNNQLWTLMSASSDPQCDPADGDGGLAVFQSTYGNRDSQCRMISPKLDLSAYDVPEFSFCIYHSLSVNNVYDDDPFMDNLTVELLGPDGEFRAFTSPIYIDDKERGSGWYQYTYDLSDFKDLGWGRISFLGNGYSGQDIAIDRVQMQSKALYDLGVYTFAGPAEVAAGKKAVYKGVIANYGVEKATRFSAVLLRDGVEVARQDNPAVIDKNTTAPVRFEVIPTEAEIGKTYVYTLRIEYADDNHTANNLSSPVTTRVVAPQYPEVHRLDGNADEEGNVVLTWGDADVLRINDSFENYTAFTIDEIGDYTLVDGDGANTYGFAQMSFDNSGEPMAYIVFNPDILGVTGVLPEFGARTGSQVLASFAAVDYATGKAVQNNDWLITPALVPGTTLSFFAKTANYEWGYESFEVMYSTGSLSTTAFRTLDVVSEVPSDWTKYEFTVPADAKYMAIHYNSEDKFLFYVDDLAFIQHYEGNAFTLTGFRVYRDGRAIADLPADIRTYKDKVSAGEQHRYTVRALYGTAESAPSDPYYAYGTGISTPTADGVAVRVNARTVTVDCPADAFVTVSDAKGLRLHESRGSASRRFTAPAAGVYIVTVDNKPYKVMVK